MRAHKINAQKYFLRQVMELWFSIAQNRGQKNRNLKMSEILMKTKDLLGLDVFTKNLAQAMLGSALARVKLH